MTKRINRYKINIRINKLQKTSEKIWGKEEIILRDTRDKTDE